MVDRPEEVNEKQMEAWVKDVDSWDACDQVCMNLFEKTPFARRKIVEWARREEEYVKRAAFALIACLAAHDKQAPDRAFIAFLPVIEAGATDERNFVRKAVNWALRNVGKRSARLNEAALRTARRLLRLDAKAARWIARDAIRELESDGVRTRVRASGRGREVRPPIGRFTLKSALEPAGRAPS
jgi:3-methyladenine DNA glycosylase AlkD